MGQRAERRMGVLYRGRQKGNKSVAAYPFCRKCLQARFETIYRYRLCNNHIDTEDKYTILDCGKFHITEQPHNRK